MALAEGSASQRHSLQAALERWWPALMMFFGPNEADHPSSHQKANLRYRIRTKTNEELRQRFLTKYVPRIRSLGLVPPDPTLHYDAEQGRWIYQQPDWEWFRRIINGQGPASSARLTLKRLTYEEGRWARAALAQGR